jgi:NAD(P)-dependent dehydrogenase (short-subunit alcohol dehydrogenase family)
VLESLPQRVPCSQPEFRLIFTGCNIAINYANSTDRAEKFVKELESAFPNLKFSVIQADVGIKSSCEKLIEETISQLGGLDIIISNAGSVKLLSVLTAGWTQFCPFEDLDFPEEAWVLSSPFWIDVRTNALL